MIVALVRHWYSRQDKTGWAQSEATNEFISNHGQSDDAVSLP